MTNFAAKLCLDFGSLRSQVLEGIGFAANVAPLVVESLRYREMSWQSNRQIHRLRAHDDFCTDCATWVLGRSFGATSG